MNKSYMTSIFRHRQLRTTVSALAVALVIAQLAACGPTEPPPEPHTAVTARAVNYTDQGAEFSINHAAGGSVVAHWQSGINCCIGIPDKWRPGLKVKVYVQNDALWLKYKDPDRWQETELEVPPYPEPGDLYVAILPDDKVEIFSSVSGPGGTNWPFRLGHPRVECLKTRSKAACGVE
ncbi:MAG TPA: DUF3304 domain-containing protein [Rhodocyclaceae bacterium]|nr:DUF3304 domain-containing protein [Rhodocyclaceae bacterium]